MRGKKILSEVPQGLFYIREFIDEDRERAILEVVETLPFGRSMYGEYEAKRTVVHYGGVGYQNVYSDTTPLSALPAVLQQIKDDCATMLGLQSAFIKQVLVTRYEDAGIGWHRDAPQYGPAVIGLSLGGSNRMRFRQLLTDTEKQFQVLLEPRSLYIMSGDARSKWQHSMPEAKSLRYSITLRTLKAETEYSDYLADGKLLRPEIENLKNNSEHLHAQFIKRRLEELDLKPQDLSVAHQKTAGGRSTVARTGKRTVGGVDSVQLKLPFAL